MNPDDIELSSMAKSFEYEKLAREIETTNDMEFLKGMLKSYIKLYLKQQETFISIAQIKLSE
jgi:hypothetical protein|tara:strand:+ start:237 stop:422 length:186 start_codon:yes stop_codon:yes gene_type:complete